MMSELPAALADLPATPAHAGGVRRSTAIRCFAIEDSEYGRAWRALGEALPARARSSSSRRIG